MSTVDWDLGLWTVVGEQFSAVPDVEYPWDPALVRRIRAFDREFMPLFAKRAYQVPGRGIIVRGYHMMGRRVPVPREHVSYLPVLRPASGRYAGIDVRGQILEATVWEGPKPRYQQLQRRGFDDLGRPVYELAWVEEADKPGPFIPFTERFVHSARRAWWEAKNLAARVRTKQAVADQVEPREQAVRDISKDLWAHRLDLREHREKRPTSVQVSPKLEQIRAAAGAAMAGAA